MQKPIEELFNEYREELLKSQARHPMAPAPYPDSAVIEAQRFVKFITDKGYEVIIKPTPEMLEAERNRLIAQREELDDRIDALNVELGYFTNVMSAPRPLSKYKCSQCGEELNGHHKNNCSRAHTNRRVTLEDCK